MFAGAVFLTALAAPGVTHLARAIIGGAPPDLGENRALAEWPAPPRSLSQALAFPDAANAALEDRFGLRAPLSRAYAELSQGVRSPGDTVVVGREGWLFFAGDSSVENYRGFRPASSQWVEGWFAQILAVQAAAEASGASFYLLTPPNKSRVYPEHMPAAFGPPSPLRRLNALRADPRMADLAWVDAESALLAVKGEGLAYRPLDTHWTMRGAHAAFLAFEAAYGCAQPTGCDRLPLRAVSFDDAGGDLARMAGFEADAASMIVDVALTDPSPGAERVLEDAENPIFRTRIFTGRHADGPRLVLIGDSFADALLPFLRERFGEVVLVHHQLGRADIEYALSFEPDVVLLEMVERYAERALDFRFGGERVSSAP